MLAEWGGSSQCSPTWDLYGSCALTTPRLIQAGVSISVDFSSHIHVTTSRPVGICMLYEAEGLRTHN